MAFFITMPPDFKIGETRDCRINKKPERLTWRDRDTLVIEPGDARKVVYMDNHDGGLHFACADADGTKPMIIISPTDGGPTVIVKPPQ